MDEPADRSDDAVPVTPTSEAAPEPAFACPRCGRATTAEFYGPCARCHGELRLRYQAVARQVEAVAYEPKSNVTPNAVALRDD